MRCIWKPYIAAYCVHVELGKFCLEMSPRANNHLDLYVPFILHDAGSHYPMPYDCRSNVDSDTLKYQRPAL